MFNNSNWVKFDYMLTSDSHVYDLCKKKGKNLEVSTKIKRGSEFLSDKIELRNWVTQSDITLRVTYSEIFIESLLSS